MKLKWDLPHACPETTTQKEFASWLNWYELVEKVRTAKDAEAAKAKLKRALDFGIKLPEGALAGETLADYKATQHARETVRRCQAMAKAMAHDEKDDWSEFLDLAAQKKGSDYTAAFVVGFASDGNLYILDMGRDRLNSHSAQTCSYPFWEPFRPRSITLASELFAMVGVDLRRNKALNTKERWPVNNIIYIVGLIVVVLIVLSFLGLR